MKFEEALYSYLTSISALTNLVDYKIFPLKIPQNTDLPAVYYKKISEDNKRSATEGQYGLLNPIYQVSIFALTYSGLKAIEKAVKDALINYQGSMGDIEIQGCFIVSEIDDHEIKETFETYIMHLDFEFYYNN